MLLQVITILIAVYGAILSTVQWLAKQRKKVKINYDVENYILKDDGSVVSENLILRVINVSEKPIFVKSFYLLYEKTKIVPHGPEYFLTGKDEQLPAAELKQIDPERGIDIIYQKDKVENFNVEKFILEDETGKKFSIPIDLKNKKPKIRIIKAVG